MRRAPLFCSVAATLFLLALALPAAAQSFRVQCPSSTTMHPTGDGIKCQQLSGGDGFATMGDGTQTYLFGFGPLSGLKDIYNGKPGTQPSNVFNVSLETFDPIAFANFLGGSGPSTLIGMPDSNFTFNGAIGLTGDPAVTVPVDGGARATATLLAGVIDTITITNPGTSANDPADPRCYALPPDVIISTSGGASGTATATVANCRVTSITIVDGGVGYTSTPTITFSAASDRCSSASPPSQCLTGHVDPRQIMDVGVMNASQPAPLIAIDEDDEFFLTLTNVGQIMRPDLFEQHTVHFHGYPNASAFYDGVPDASIAINVGGSFTYYYLAPDAGTYFWHCHISPPEHLQMGMVGQLYVKPRQNRVSGNLHDKLNAYETAPSGETVGSTAYYERLRKRCGTDVLCSSPVPPANLASNNGTKMYAYNDGDGTTEYHVEYPIQMHGFDPNFHFVGMTFNPENFSTMKDKYFMLNGRGYPDTTQEGPMQTQSTDGTLHSSQPLPTIINIPAGKRALLRISDLNVTEYHTLASLGIPMKVIALNARLLRDMAGNNMYYDTNSITLGGGESLDVILDATGYTAGQKFYLYTPQLDHLSNDAENFGGMMTEVNICNSVDPLTKACS